MTLTDDAQAALPLTSSDLSLFALFWQAHWLVKAVMVGLLLASVWVWAIVIDKFLLYARTRKAMDVFEHLTDPVEVVENLWTALKPGGFLYARIAVESDEDRPQHIVRDFEPTFERMRALGFVEVWRDDWLWGHQVFQKS